MKILDRYRGYQTDTVNTRRYRKYQTDTEDTKQIQRILRYRKYQTDQRILDRSEHTRQKQRILDRSQTDKKDTRQIQRIIDRYYRGYQTDTEYSIHRG